MNESRFNGWQVLSLVLILWFAFGCAWATMKVMVPAAVAEISGQRAVITSVNTAFADRDKRIATLETEVKMLKEIQKTK